MRRWGEGASRQASLLNNTFGQVQNLAMVLSSLSGRGGEWGGGGERVKQPATMPAIVSYHPRLRLTLVQQNNTTAEIICQVFASPPLPPLAERQRDISLS